MVNFMYAANQYFRRSRPINRECMVCAAYQAHGLVEISFPSVGCRYDLAGSCIACDYGRGTPPDNWTVIEPQMDRILENTKEAMEILLLCTNGSFFCDENIPPALRRRIMEKAAKTVAGMIIIESHVHDITEAKLSEFAQICGGKKLCLEIGIESMNPFVRKNCYCKNISESKLSDCFELTKKHQIKLSAHFMLGAPFLTPMEQLDDLLMSVKAAQEKDAEVVLFPVNIKPYTLLMYVYSQDFYQPISHWLFIEALSRIDAGHLDEVCIAWYGNREMKYERARGTVFPSDCPQCGEILQQFYDRYSPSKSSSDRSLMIAETIRHGSECCSCYRNMLDALMIKTSVPLEERVKQSHGKLLRRLQDDGIIL